MKGLELQYADNIITGSSKDGVVCIIISMSKECADVCMRGIDRGNHVKWYESSLKTGDNIRIRVKDIDQSSEYHITGSKIDSLKKEFNLLEKELKEKGLI
jgi:hypothetical protein